MVLGQGWLPGRNLALNHSLRHPARGERDLKLYPALHPSERLKICLAGQDWNKRGGGRARSQSRTQTPGQGAPERMGQGVLGLQAAKALVCFASRKCGKYMPTLPSLCSEAVRGVKGPASLREGSRRCPCGVKRCLILKDH